MTVWLGIIKRCIGDFSNYSIASEKARRLIGFSFFSFLRPIKAFPPWGQECYDWDDGPKAEKKSTSQESCSKY
jgi:hypothetical protein